MQTQKRKAMTRSLYKIIKQKTTSVERLNAIFTPLTFQERIRKLYDYFEDDEVLMTSSFGTKSVFLLYWVSKLRPAQRVYFIDTGYHFPETIAYKETLTEQFGLDLVDVHPNPNAHRRTQEQHLWNKNPDNCCYVNKVAPLKPLKARHKVWISGLMAQQTDYRSNLQIFEEQDGIIKFHPILDIDEGEFLYDMQRLELPRHPLEAMGYGSIGCTHCTRPGSGRSGRWADSDKTECGLHPDYFARQAARKR